MMSTSLLILAMVKKYIVTLTAEERAELEQFSTTGRRAADQITRARILLKADSNQPDGSWMKKLHRL